MIFNVIAFTGVMITMIIFYFNRKNIYLAIFYLLFVLNGMHSYALFFSNNAFLATVINIHFFPIFLLNGPVLWFYIRGEITGNLRLYRKDSWHFLPFILAIIQIIPYSLKPWSYKLLVTHYTSTINAVDFQALHVPGIFLREFFLVRIIFFFAYSVYSSYFLLKNVQNSHLLKTFWKIKWLKWFLVTTSILSLIAVLYLTVMIVFNDTILINTLIILICCFFGTFLCLLTFFFPKILYGNLIKNNPTANNLNTPSEIEITNFIKVLQTYIDGLKYNQVNFSKSRILSESKTSDRIFTYYFNEYLKLNFSQWRNQLRIEYSITLIKEGYLSNYTVESLAHAVGFQSRNSFTSTFKSQTGLLPSEFISLK